MSRTPRINKVSSNMNKHLTYTELNRRKDVSLKNKDYFSVVHYSYAMIEDRLLSILHYLYIIDRNEYPYRLEKKMEKSFTNLLYPKKENDCSKPNFNNLNTKINALKKICNYKNDDENIVLIKNHLEKVLSVEDFKNDLNSLNKWKGFRNEYTHSIYNKNIEDIDNSIEKQAEDGDKLAKKFDKYSDLLKGKIYATPSLRSQIESLLK